MSTRKGMMIGSGKRGYHNVIGKDPSVHSQSAQGIKQPQNVNIITPKLEGWETPLEQDRSTIKVDLDEFKKINQDDITTSDLQGVAMGYGIKYLGSNNHQAVSEIEDVFLQYSSGDLNINEAKRYILDIIIQNKDKDQLKGGLGDNRPDSAFDKKELAKGIKVEMEHTNNPAIAKEIAKDHETEFPKVKGKSGYYDELDKMEKKLKKENKTTVKDKTIWHEYYGYMSKEELEKKQMEKAPHIKMRYWSHEN